MKTAAFVLEEPQIEWVKEEAARQGGTTASAIIRRLINKAMISQVAEGILSKEQVSPSPELPSTI